MKLKRNILKALGLIIMVFGLGMLLSLVVPPKAILFIITLVMICVGFSIFRIC